MAIDIGIGFLFFSLFGGVFALKMNRCVQENPDASPRPWRSVWARWPALFSALLWVYLPTAILLFGAWFFASVVYVLKPTAFLPNILLFSLLISLILHLAFAVYALSQQFIVLARQSGRRAIASAFRFYCRHFFKSCLTFLLMLLMTSVCFFLVALVLQILIGLNGPELPEMPLQDQLSYQLISTYSRMFLIMTMAMLFAFCISSHFYLATISVFYHKVKHGIDLPGPKPSDATKPTEQPSLS